MSANRCRSICNNTLSPKVTDLIGMTGSKLSLVIPHWGSCNDDLSHVNAIRQRSRRRRVNHAFTSTAFKHKASVKNGQVKRRRKTSEHKSEGPEKGTCKDIKVIWGLIPSLQFEISKFAYQFGHFCPDPRITVSRQVLRDRFIKSLKSRKLYFLIGLDFTGILRPPRRSEKDAASRLTFWRLIFLHHVLTWFIHPLISWGSPLFIILPRESKKVVKSSLLLGLFFSTCSFISFDSQME